VSRDGLIVRARRGYTLVFDPETHTYTLQKDGQEHILPSVTRVLSVIAKPKVNAWAMDLMAQHILDNYSPGMSLEDMTLLTQEARGMHLEESRKATGTGSEVHDWIEAFLQGLPRGLPVNPSSIRVSGGLLWALGEGVLTLGVGYGPDWRVRLGYSGKGFTAYAGTQGTGLSLRGEKEGVGWGLGLTLTPTLQGQVNLEWRVPVPEGVTLVLGGYPGVRPVEGRVTLEGEPLAGARVVYREVAATTDSTGRYRIYLPEGAVARVIPPEGVLALEGSAQGGEVDLKRAGALLPDCRGEFAVNGRLYPCGRLVVAPGRYTLTHGPTSLVVEVAPGEERVVEFPPPPPPPPLGEAETPLFLEIPGPLPGGGEVELLATGEEVETPWGTFAVENGRVWISIPPGVSGQFTFRILGGGRSKEYSVEVR
jgi:hypothetical protein